MHKSLLCLILLILTLAIGIYFYQRNSPRILPNPLSRKDSSKQIVKTDRPFSHGIFESNLKSIKDVYPEQVKTSIVGHSVLGRDLYLIRLGTGKPKLLITGIFHGREWLTGMLTLKMAEEYAKAAKHGKPIGSYQPNQLLKKGSILFVPMVNPDGVEIVLTEAKGTQIQAYYAKPMRGIVTLPAGRPMPAELI